MKNVFRVLSFFLSLFLYTACGNFFNDNDDFLEKIKIETAYHNAPEVDCVVFVESVTQGRLITNPDVKKMGYPFEISFFVEKDFPGKFDRWIVYEDYSFGKNNKEVTDSSVVLVEPLKDPTYEKVRITVYDSSKKLTVVPHCIANPTVQVQVEQKYQGQVSVFGPSNVELGIPYDISLKTSSVLGFSKWDTYTLKNKEKENVSCYISNNLELTDEEIKSDAYISSDLVFYDAKPVVTEDGTSISMKMILKKDLGSKLIIDGVLFSYPSLIVKKDRIAYTKLGKTDSKVSELSTLVDPYNLSGNLTLTNLSVVLTNGYDFLNKNCPFKIENFSGQEIKNVLYTEKSLENVLYTEGFENAALVFTECFIDSNGEFSSKVFVKESDTYVLYSNTYVIPEFYVTGNSREVSFPSGNSYSVKIGVIKYVMMELASKVQCKGFEVLDRTGTVIEDHSNLVSIKSSSNNDYEYEVIVLSPDFDGCSIHFITGLRPYIEKISPSKEVLAQAESIQIYFSKDFDSSKVLVNKRKIHVFIDSIEDLKGEYFTKNFTASNVLTLENKKRLSEGSSVVLKFDDGIISSDGYESKSIPDYCFGVNDVLDNIPPSVVNPVLYAHNLPKVKNYNKVVSCTTIYPGEFDIAKLDISDLYNDDKNHIRTVNVNKKNYEGCNIVDEIEVDGLDDNHFVLSFTADDTSSGNSNIESITLEERVVYLPGGMVVPKRITPSVCYEYERISGDGIELYDESGKFQAIKYFSGTSDELKKFFYKKLDIPVSGNSSTLDIHYPFSSSLKIGGVHEFVLEIRDTNCKDPRILTFCVYFGPQLSFTPYSFSYSNKVDFTYTWYDYASTFKNIEVTPTSIYYPQNKFGIKASSIVNYNYVSGGKISFYFSYNDLVKQVNRENEKPFLMVLEKNTEKYEFIDEKTSFTNDNLSGRLNAIRKGDKSDLKTVTFYTHEIDEKIPEGYYIKSYDNKSVSSTEGNDFGFSYIPSFLNMSGHFDFEIYDIDEYGTAYLIPGKEIKEVYVNKYLVGDVVFWNKMVNSFFVKHYSELETLDTSSVPFAVIAYVDQNSVYGIPLEASDNSKKWSSDSTKSSYKICTTGMKNGDSFDAKGIFKEISDSCSRNFSNFPALKYVSDFGVSLGFDSSSENKKVKALATEWCLPTYEMFKSFRSEQGSLTATFSQFGKSFPYCFGYSFWLCNYGSSNTASVQNAESCDPDHEKMPYYWWAWGDAKLANRNTEYSVIPVIELSDIIGN